MQPEGKWRVGVVWRFERRAYKSGVDVGCVVKYVPFQIHLSVVLVRRHPALRGDSRRLHRGKLRPFGECLQDGEAENRGAHASGLLEMNRVSCGIAEC